MTDQNNIGDFFRNRINDSGEGSWDKPSSHTREKLLVEIGSASGFLTLLGMSGLFKLFAGLAFISLIGSSAFFYIKNERLAESMAESLASLETEKYNLKSEITDLQEQLENKAFEIESKDNELLSHKDEIDLLQNKLLISERRNTAHLFEINQYEEKLSLLNEKLEDLSKIQNAKLVNSKYEEPVSLQSITSLSLLELPLLQIPERRANIGIPNINLSFSKAIRASYFEVGYRIGFQSLFWRRSISSLYVVSSLSLCSITVDWFSSCSCKSVI